MSENQFQIADTSDVALLRRAKWRVTPQRLAILQALTMGGHLASCQAVWEKAQAFWNPRSIRSWRSRSRDAGVRVVTDLYGDTLGPAGSDGDMYIKMMRHNTALSVSALR